MTELEIKVLTTKHKLQSDISAIDAHILWLITSKAKTILNEQVKAAKWPQDVPESDIIVSIPKKEWDEILDYLYYVSSGNYDKIEKYMRDKMMEKEIKEKILKSLQP